MSGVLKAAMSARLLVIRKRPRAEKSLPMTARSMASAPPDLDQLVGLTRQGHNIVPKNANADVMKIVICKHSNVALFFR
jgi:hypothetical protein